MAPTYTLKVTLKLSDELQNTVVIPGLSKELIGSRAEQATVLLDNWAEQIQEDVDK